MLSNGFILDSTQLLSFDASGEGEEKKVVELEEIINRGDIEEYTNYFLRETKRENDCLQLKDIKRMGLRFIKGKNRKTFVFSRKTPSKLKKKLSTKMTEGPYGKLKTKKKIDDLYIIFERIPDTVINYELFYPLLSGKIHVVDINEFSINASEHFFAPIMDIIPFDDEENLKNELGILDIISLPIIYDTDIGVKLLGLEEKRIVRIDNREGISYRRVFKSAKVYIRK